MPRKLCLLDIRCLAAGTVWADARLRLVDIYCRFDRQAVCKLLAILDRVFTVTVVHDIVLLAINAISGHMHLGAASCSRSTRCDQLGWRGQQLSSWRLHTFLNPHIL